jgi:transposase
LFTGSENGGKTMAVLFSVVSSCQRHGHDPFVYLCDVLTRLPDHPEDRLEDLLPNRWSPPLARASTSEEVGPEGAHRSNESRLSSDPKQVAPAAV